MDLALEFGIPNLGKMSEREFARWIRYAGLKMLPARRIEMYLAQICLMVARGPLADSGDLTIKDFLFDRVDDDEDEEPDIEAMRAALGWTPPPEE